MSILSIAYPQMDSRLNEERIPSYILRRCTSRQPLGLECEDFDRKHIIANGSLGHCLVCDAKVV